MMSGTNNFHTKKIVAAGKNLEDAEKALVMLHGRGANATDILSVADYLNVSEFALLAPQATNNTWYLILLWRLLRKMNRGYPLR